MARAGEYWAPPSQAKYYAERVREAAIRRRAGFIARVAADEAQYEPRMDWLAQLQDSILDLEAESQNIPTLAQIVDKSLEEVQKFAAERGSGVEAVSTGLVALDNVIHGFKPGRLYVGAGRPGHGKTSLAMTMIRANVAAGRRCGFISLEMPPGEVIRRYLSAESGVPGDRIEAGLLNSAELDSIQAAARGVREWQLDVVGHASTWNEVRAETRRLALGGCRLIAIDYVGLIAGFDHRISRREQIGTITRELKKLAIAYDVPILLLAQINREVSREKKHLPQLWHLRDSGDIEQDADVVLMVHQPHQYDDTLPADQAQVFVRKHRGGYTADLDFGWDGPTTSFSDLSEKGYVASRNAPEELFDE